MRYFDETEGYNPPSKEAVLKLVKKVLTKLKTRDLKRPISFITKPQDLDK